MVTLLAAWMYFKPLTLGDFPISNEVAVGAKLARTGKGMDRLLLEDRQVVGKWAKSITLHDAEDVIWVSPDLVSRWLGYLQETENLTTPEVRGRLAQLAMTQGRSLWFVVRLAALDKQDPLEFGAGETAHNDDLDPVVIKATLTDLAGQRQTLQISDTSLLASVTSSDADDLVGLPWYIYSDAFRALLPAVPPSAPQYDLGTNQARLLFVRVDIPTSLIAASEVEVRVLSRRKVRIARFPLLRHQAREIQSPDANRDVQRGVGTG